MQVNCVLEENIHKGNWGQLSNILLDSKFLWSQSLSCKQKDNLGLKGGNKATGC